MTGAGGRHIFLERQDGDHPGFCLFMRTFNAVELRIWEPRIGVRAVASDAADPFLANLFSPGDLRLPGTDPLPGRGRAGLRLLGRHGSSPSHAFLFVWRIGDEEKLLHQEFGESWEAYARRTRRLVPFVY